MNQASAAFDAEDWPTLNEALDAAQASRPWSLYVYRNRILARVLAGREEDALALAEKAASRGLTLSLTGHPAFEKLTAMPEFAAVAARIADNAKPFGEATIFFEDGPDDLLPEALAFNGKGDAYVGSVRNGSLWKHSAAGEFQKLESPLPGGVFDIETSGAVLFAAINSQLNYVGEPSSPKLVKIAATTGAVLSEYDFALPDVLIGDFEMTQKGDWYASDSMTPRIFYKSRNEAVADAIQDPRFVNLQGLALDEKHKRLFVADYLAGLFVIDLKSGAVVELANHADAHLGGIDGLYYYDGDLIGIQNGISPQRIVRIGLDKDATAVERFTTLQANLPGWNEPTHGAVYGRTFYYIATSNWPAYDDDGVLIEGAALKPLTIMSLPLESK